jgi:hypothetical protein
MIDKVQNDQRAVGRARGIREMGGVYYQSGKKIAHHEKIPNMLEK